jgi:hypothetical protein
MGHFKFESDVIAEESGLTIIQKDHPDCIVLKTREEKNNRSLDWFDTYINRDTRVVEVKLDSHVEDNPSINRYTGRTFMEFFSQSGIVGGIYKAYLEKVSVFIYRFLREDKENLKWVKGSNHDLELIMDTKKLFDRIIRGIFIEGHTIHKSPNTSYGVLTPIDYIKDLHDPSLLLPSNKIVRRICK